MAQQHHNRQRLIRQIVDEFGCTPTEAEGVIDHGVPWDWLRQGIPVGHAIQCRQTGIETVFGAKRALEREADGRTEHEARVRQRQAAKDRANERLRARQHRAERVRDLKDRIIAKYPTTPDEVASGIAAVGVDARAPVMRWLKAGVAPEDITPLWRAGVRDDASAVRESAAQAERRHAEATRRAHRDALAAHERAFLDRVISFRSRPEPDCPACGLRESACRC